MYSEEFFRKQLSTIKNKLKGRDMSLIIGAGLSKSVNDKFPLWNELLFDMAKAIYEPELQNEYQNLPKTKKGNYSEFLKNRIDTKLHTIGYLELVSTFVKLNGYREIVDNYIEEHIPKIETNDADTFLVVTKNGTQQKIPLGEQALDLHRQVLKLPWNNIYTTNYDTLIEHCIDNNIAETLQTHIDTLLDNIREQEVIQNSYPQKIEDKQKELDDFDQKTKQEQQNSNSILSVDKKVFNNDEDDKTVTGINTDRSKKQNELIQLRLKLGSAKKIIGDNYEKIEKLRALIRACLNVVTKSQQLAVKRNHNLIKLHGTIGIDTYGFDNDSHNHYVISSEDYATYPQKHEAFTQLMRISLLQESFCLMGFSGVDPNFLAWIGWVRDILNKDTTTNDKIFLVEATSNEPTKDRSLYFGNNKIVYIPILNKHCIAFLEKELDRKINSTSPKEVLLALTRFLNDGKFLDKPRIALELLALEDYKQTWSNVKIDKRDKVSLEEILQSGKDVRSLDGIIPDINFAYSHNRESLLFFSNQYCKQAKSLGEKEQLAELLIAVFNDQLVPYKIYDSDDDVLTRMFDEVIDKNLQQSIQLLKLKDAIWKNDTRNFKKILAHRSLNVPNRHDELTYLQTFSALINFDFAKAQQILENWAPKDRWKTKKAGLLAYFSIDDAISLLKDTEPLQVHAQMYNYELLSFLLRAKNWSSEDDTFELVKMLEAEGLRTISKATDYLITQVVKPNIDLKPYGKNRFSIGQEFHASSVPTAISALQYFGILFESGFPLVVPSMQFDTYERIYPLMKKAFVHYPDFILFYAIQYGNEDFTKRIAQDFVFADEISNDLPRIAKNIKKAYFSKATPARWKETLLTFCSELFVALPANIWEDFFLRVWQKLRNENLLFVDLRRFDNDFIDKGLRLIAKSKTISAIVNDCLKNFNIQNGNPSIGYLFELAHNPNLKKYADQIGEDVSKQINQLIAGLSEDASASIFLLGNLEVILTSQQRKAIAEKLSKFDFTKISDTQIWHVVFFFIKDDADTIVKLRKGILDSKKLWNTGIREDGAARYPFEFIALSKLRPTAKRSGITWSVNEKKIITGRLRNEFKKLKKFHDSRNTALGHETILEEMLSYVKEEMSKGKAKDKLQGDINALYSAQVGFDEISSGLAATDHSQVVIALGALSKKIYQDRNILDVKNLVILIFNKIMLKSEPALEASLFYFSSWLDEFSDDVVFNELSEDLVSLLKLYRESIPESVNKVYVLAQLYRIAGVLKNWGLEDEIIDSILKNTRYNFSSLLQKN